MTRNRVIVFLVAGAVFIAVAYGLFLYVQQYSIGNREPQMTASETVEPVMYIVGDITAISGDTLTIKVQYPIDVTPGSSLNERTVVISSGVVITRTVFYDAEKIAENDAEFQKKVAAYEERRNAVSPTSTTPFTEEPPTYPTNFYKETVGRDALQIGKSINVTTDTDIRTLPRITAVSVEIMPNPSGSGVQETPNEVGTSTQ